MMKSAFKMMHFAFKMINLVLKMMHFDFKMLHFVLKMSQCWRTASRGNSGWWVATGIYTGDFCILK